MWTFNAIATSFLKDELKQNGISNYIPELIKYEDAIAELGYALSPVIHEGKIQSYGFIAISNGDSINKIISDQPFNLSDGSTDVYYSFSSFTLPEARRIADGCHSFSIFVDGQFKGVLTLQNAQNELQMVQLQQELKAIICTTDTSGVTRIFCEAGVIIHQYRRWQRKPSINSAIQSISRCVPQADGEILRDILEFCFHDLSPRKIGATLVWCLTDISPEEMKSMKPNFALKQIETKVGDALSTAILRHLLTYTDGAAILSMEAKVVGVGAQLKYSDDSKRLIEAYAGTRHTSARRFSYDFAKVVMFVVSSDGPVTIFSDGMSVVDLRVQLAEMAIENTPTPTKLEVVSCSNELNCPTCEKRIKIQETEFVDDKDNKEIFCPVCGRFIYSVSCSGLDVYIVKDLTNDGLCHQA